MKFHVVKEKLALLGGFQGKPGQLVKTLGGNLDMSGGKEDRDDDGD